MFNVEIQDGYQMGLPNDFWGKSAVDSAAILRVKNLVQIALSRSISKISGFLRLIAKIQDGRQNWRGKRFLRKVASRLCRYPAGQKLRQKLHLSRFNSKINTFLHFIQKFKMAAKSGREKVFW